MSSRLRVSCFHDGDPANMRRWPNVGLLLGQRRRRGTNSKPTLSQRLMFAGVDLLSLIRGNQLNSLGEIVGLIKI